MSLKILLTGGSGDLGRVLTPRLEGLGHKALRLDIRPPADGQGTYIEGSILDEEALVEYLDGVDVVVHIAAWHGIHEVTGQKGVRDFLELNVMGTHSVLNACLQAGVNKIVNISSTSVDEKEGIYGSSKLMSESIARVFLERHKMNIISLRPRAFIPYWNTAVYADYVEWAKWFWPGAVHINDVAEAVVQAIDLLNTRQFEEHLVLPLDSKYEYTEEDLLEWDKDGPGSSFKKYYGDYYELALEHGLDPSLKPARLDTRETEKWLGYAPAYSLMNLLQELEEFGSAGPPHP